jgi:hypothetical protein
MTIDVRGAVVAAQKYLQSMADLIGGHVLEIRLEEVELSEDKSLWLITLSFIVPISKDSISNLGILAGESLKPERQYKIFEIDSETGQMKSMKIRDLSWT